jgi:hypothetical protein
VYETPKKKSFDPVLKFLWKNKKNIRNNIVDNGITDFHAQTFKRHFGKIGYQLFSSHCLFEVCIVKSSAGGYVKIMT